MGSTLAVKRIRHCTTPPCVVLSCQEVGRGSGSTKFWRSELRVDWDELITGEGSRDERLCGENDQTDTLWDAKWNIPGGGLIFQTVVCFGYCKSVHIHQSDNIVKRKGLRLKMKVKKNGPRHERKSGHIEVLFIAFTLNNMLQGPCDDKLIHLCKYLISQLTRLKIAVMSFIWYTNFWPH